MILGPVMLDAWEKLLFFSCLLGIAALLVLTILRSPPVVWAGGQVQQLIATHLLPRLKLNG